MERHIMWKVVVDMKKVEIHKIKIKKGKKEGGSELCKEEKKKREEGGEEGSQEKISRDIGDKKNCFSYKSCEGECEESNIVRQKLKKERQLKLIKKTPKRGREKEKMNEKKKENVKLDSFCQTPKMMPL